MKLGEKLLNNLEKLFEGKLIIKLNLFLNLN